MPFDLATARPADAAQPARGFDLASAKAQASAAPTGGGSQNGRKYVPLAERERRVRQEMGSQEDWTGNIPAPAQGAGKVIAGIPEMALSGITGAAGTLADVATMDDPGTHDWSYRPRTGPGQFAAQQVNSLLGPVMAGVSAGYDKAFGTGPLSRTIKERGAQAAEAVGTVMGAGALARTVAKTAARAPLAVAAPVGDLPTLAELKVAKDAAYKAADETGVVISRSALNRLKTELVNDLKKEGIDRDLHPKSTAAVKRILEKKGQLSLSELETLRKIGNDAKGSIEKSDARLGARIVDKIDDFEEGLGESDVASGNPAAATAYKKARALNTRLSKATQIQDLFDRAELNAPNFSGSGMENALRTEFRALAKNKREIRKFNAEEREAIRKVAVGGPVENILRQLGKLAPTGVVSAGLGPLGGFAVGGPAGAVAVPAVGSISRYAATKMTMGNAKRAGDLMRRGPLD